MFNEDIKNRLDTVMEMIDTAIARTNMLFHKNQLDDTPEALAFFDAACMNLFVIGETLKGLDNKTNGQYLIKYPDIPWKDVIKTRDIIAHHYKGLKKEIIFSTLKNDLPSLRTTIQMMIDDIDRSLVLKEDAISTIIERTKEPVRSFSPEQKDKINKYLISEWEEDKNNCVENVWNEAERRMRIEHINGPWIKDTHSEILDFIKGIERSQSNELKL